MANSNRYGSMDRSGASRDRFIGRGPVSFTELNDAISNNMFKVTVNITSLERDSKLIGTQHDSSQLRDQLHAKEQETNKLVLETKELLVKMHSVVEKSNRTQLLQYERLTEELKNTAQRYQDIQKGIAKLAKQKPLQAVGRLIDFGEQENENISREEALLKEEERRLQLQQQEDSLKIDLALVQEREQGIRQLESDILDINSMFRDLATMVHEQGETINSIEANVEQASGNVEAGRDHLISAANYQRSARKKMCCLILILLIVAAIITLIIVLSLKH